MNKLTFLAALTVLLFLSCESNQDHINPEQGPTIEDKSYPYYERELEKSFPHTQLDIPAYERGKRQVHEDIQKLRSRSRGFDLPWTIQGPGNLGARVNTLGIHPTDRDIMFAGFAGGGLWRTTNGGDDWASVFDTEIFNSISDITFDEENPSTIYIGTGDPNVPGRAFIGDGVYKSTDMGDTWTNIGLQAQRVISKIRIHPDDSQTVYAGSMGLPFTKNDTRGLFRSTNGGTDWEKIFYISDSTGVSDFMINPEETNMMYAATWDRVRNDSVSLGYGLGSGIYVSADSGENWNRAVGIPDTMLCRTGLAICETQPNNVYAVTVGTDYQLNGIYRSRDYGMTFTEVESEFLRSLEVLAGFGWYFGKIEVDPIDPEHFYILGVDLWETTDGGFFWDLAGPDWWSYELHADKHDLSISIGRELILATDGGVYRGKKFEFDGWEDIENIPTTQFYRVGYNPHEPDTYYGGAQDNGTTAGNNQDINDWPRIVGGDGFQTIFDPIDPDHWFAETQRGGIRMTTDNGQSFQRVTEGLNGDKNWDMQYIMSPHDNKVLYTGTDTVYAAYDSYDPEWVPISGNLTEGGFPTSLSTTISDINESPLAQGHLFVGTSNGLVHRSLDAGLSWELISEDLPNRYVSSVKPSPNFAGTVYTTFTGYKFNEFIPRVYRSDDNGDTWKSISGNLPDIAINDVYILDGYKDKVLFVATDGGIYGSVDAGESWERVGLDMPNIPCYDMEHNVVNQELVVASFGRGIMTYPLEALLETVSVDEQMADLQLTVYPNPASDYIHFDLKTGANSAVAVRIMDRSGLLVLESISTKIDIQSLDEGLYIYVIKSKEGTYSGKFSKQG